MTESASRVRLTSGVTANTATLARDVTEVNTVHYIHSHCFEDG